MIENREDIGQLRQQVIGLDKGYTELRKDFHILDQKMDQKFDDSDRKMNAGFANIAALLDKKSTPQWQAYTLIVTVFMSLGGALYYPIKTELSKVDTQIEMLRTMTVPRVEHERLWREEAERSRFIDERAQRIRDDAAKTRSDLDYMRGQLHSTSK